MDEASKRVVLRKVAWCLLPFLFLLYVINILDRANVGFARLQMLKDKSLAIDENVYAVASGIFYVGYLTFEVPSNLIMRRTGARRWIARIMMSWGLITAAMMAIRGPYLFYLLRILLGIAEAGFFPGMILYLTWWFPARERARAVALFMAGSPITGALGSPLSGAILQYMDKAGGLSGWQWLFLLEGAPAVVLGLVVLGYLTDRPEQARWLTAEERSWLASRIDQEESHREKQHGLTLLTAFADPRVWLLILLYFTVAAGSNTIGFYLPALLEDRIPSVDKFQLGLLTAIPHVCAILGMVLNGMHSDRTGERRWHVAFPALLAAAGWALTAVVESPVPSLLALTLVQVGIMSMLPVFWSLPTAFLSGVAAAGGIALINSVGNLGGFAGPFILGSLKASTGRFTSGLLAMALLMLLGGLLALQVRHDRSADRSIANDH
jgi:ACS family tartrate transporter-like MFS transporter